MSKRRANMRRLPQPRRAPQRRAGTVARGYGAAHKAERERWARIVAAGLARCARCGEPVRGPFHLDHHDTDRTRYIGVSHPGCNIGAAQRRRWLRASGRDPDVPQPQRPQPAALRFFDVGGDQ